MPGFVPQTQQKGMPETGSWTPLQICACSVSYWACLKLVQIEKANDTDSVLKDAVDNDLT